MSLDTPRREGSLEAPTRHPIAWKSPDFWEEEKLFQEMERIFDICHGCRRCFNLCNSFPTLFDAVDESDTGEVDGVAREVYWKVVDHCYLCDMCYMSKCPYVPPHEWNVDFPHLMLRAKAVRFRGEGASRRDRILTSTDTVGRLAGIPVVAEAVNAINATTGGRKLLESMLGVHRDAVLPKYHSKSMRSRLKGRAADREGTAAEGTRGRVALFATCYGNRNMPQVGEDLVKVFEHNGIPVRLVDKERCCGMPKMELGDLESVQQAMEANIPVMARAVDEGWDLVALVPSCVLMFKQELPLLFPEREDVKKVAAAMYDPFEYLALRHRAGLLQTKFATSLGKVSYQVPCHLRVQNIGLKTRDILGLVQDTKVEAIERCSGHDGTYAVKKEFHDNAVKIGRPVVNRVKGAGADHFVSDCPMAGDHIAHGLKDGSVAQHPITLLRTAYGL
jgi:glycerol-3-phosphate dehydrogenase subunit C